MLGGGHCRAMKEAPWTSGGLAGGENGSRWLWKRCGLETLPTISFKAAWKSFAGCGPTSLSGCELRKQLVTHDTDTQEGTLVPGWQVWSGDLWLML